MSPHTFRRRSRRHQRPAGDRTERQAQQPATQRVVPVCPVCGEPVQELSSALTHRQSGGPAHFDCIVKELREANPLGPQERLCYLGGGVFGVLTWKIEGNPASFVIKRRIPYEDPHAPQEWKQQLQAAGQSIVGMPVMPDSKETSGDAG
jgi:hypothetical protein